MNIRRWATAVLLTAFAAAVSAADLPHGWQLQGSRPQDYTAALDRKVFHGGAASASLASVAASPEGFGTLMQTSAADAYRDKRLRLSAQIRASEVVNWAGLWLRVDGDRGNVLAFDNMNDRPIKGSADWQRHEIVLDVSAQATVLAYGLLLSGKGRVWVDDLRFEVVDASVPLTRQKPKPEPATNLDFED